MAGRVDEPIADIKNTIFCDVKTSSAIGRYCYWKAVHEESSGNRKKTGIMTLAKQAEKDIEDLGPV